MRMFKKKKRVAAANTTTPEGPEVQPWEMGPAVEITAMGAADDTQNQANLIQARQSMGIVSAKEIVAEAISKLADRVLLDYTRETVTVRMDIDGVWHPLNPLDRQSGDMLLAVLKKLCNLNIQERRARQKGEFGVKYLGDKYLCKLTSQGTQTGERVILIVEAVKGAKISKLEEAGMREKLLEKYKEIVNHSKKGMVLISAPPSRGGLTTTWVAALGSVDRFVRDMIAIEPITDQQPEIENIGVRTYDPAAGENPAKLIPKILLKQPDTILVPEIADTETADLLTNIVDDHDMRVFTSVRAKDCAEAVLRFLMLKPNPEKYSQNLSVVLNTRLVRKLCDSCKQSYPPPPELLQRLGIPPGRVSSLCRQFQFQPTEGQKEEAPPICQECGGIGYRGRTAICELMVIDDKLRRAIVKQPKLEVLRQLSRQAKNRTLQEEGILLVAQGITSLNELQRVMKG